MFWPTRGGCQAQEGVEAFNQTFDVNVRGVFLAARRMIDSGVAAAGEAGPADAHRPSARFITGSLITIDDGQGL